MILFFQSVQLGLTLNNIVHVLTPDNTYTAGDPNEIPALKFKEFKGLV
jgi:hypothetical protein